MGNEGDVKKGFNALFIMLLLGYWVDSGLSFHSHQMRTCSSPRLQLKTKMARPEVEQTSSEVAGAYERTDVMIKNDRTNLKGLSRDQFMKASSALLLGSAALALKPQGTQAQTGFLIAQEGGEEDERLVWSSKRQFTKDGAKNTTYPQLFVTYLTRFLLTYDPGERALWRAKARALPAGGGPAAVDAARRAQFAEFAEAVELGLGEPDFRGPKGAAALCSLLLSRYGTTLEARRQVAILFCLLPAPNQPTARLRELLQETDNASVERIDVGDPGAGYLEGRPPAVRLAPPSLEAGGAAGGTPAKARAVLRPTGRLLAVRLLDGGCGFEAAPTVTFSEPPSGSKGTTGVRAEGYAVLDGFGGVRCVELTDSGAGYTDGPPTVTIGYPEDNSLCGTLPEAVVVMDYEVGAIEVVDPGNGYVSALPLEVIIDPPPPGGPPGTPKKPAFGLAYLGRQPNPMAEPLALVGASETALPGQLSISAQLTELLDSEVFLPEYDPLAKQFYLPEVEEDFLSVKTSSAGAKFGGYYDAAFITPEFFGPVGRSPVERDRVVGAGGYARFALSGAICTTLVRGALHPVDLVKCRMQKLPTQYPSLVEGFQRCKDEEILARGSGYTLLCGFLLGLTSFGCVEFVRRTLAQIAMSLDIQDATIPIILLASAFATMFSCLAVIPFETVRIKTMTSPVEDRKSSTRRIQQIALESGFSSLYRGYFPLVSRDLPFTITKFLVYDSVQKVLLAAFPVAQEEAGLTLGVSLVAGVLAGLAGAVLTTPTDNVLTQLSGNTDKGWKDVIKDLIQEGGFFNIFRGVGLRCIYFGSLISLQFFLYDYFKILFQVSNDDLKLVLDVFSDRLSFYE